MSATFEDLRILKLAEEVSDSIWKVVVQWNEFAKDVVGKQMTRSADSVGANIAESFGRFHFGEKLQFLYSSRGSIFETKYWLNRTRVRGLMTSEQVQDFVNPLTELARQLNTFASSLRAVRAEHKTKASAIHEGQAEYQTGAPGDGLGSLFSEDELNWLES